MVLSNKKLKQMLRAAKLIAAAEAANNLSNQKNEKSLALDSKTSIQNLHAQKFRLSKREKRRQKTPIKNTEVIRNGQMSSDLEPKKQDEPNSDAIQVKKRKRDESEITEQAQQLKKKKKKPNKKIEENGDLKETKSTGEQLVKTHESIEVIRNGQMSSDVEPKKQDEPNSDAIKVKKRKRDESKATENMKEKQPQQLKKKKKKKKKKPKKKVGENGKAKEEGVDHKESRSTSIGEQLVVKTDESIKKKNVETPLKVYVGGIPYYSTEDDIRSYFEGCGTITSIDCMTFPDTGKFRGIAILTFKTEPAAKRALALDGSDMGGLFLKIQPFKSARENKLPNFTPSVLEGYNRIYIGNLSWNITEDDLRKLFADCKVSSIRFGEDKETREFKGYAHVDFDDSLSLKTALKLDQTVVCGRPVKISCAVPKKGTETELISMPKNHHEDSRNKGAATVLEVTPEDSKVKSDDASVVVENQVASNVDDALSSKIRRRTCYECGERGHLSSSCRKIHQQDSGKKRNATVLEATPVYFKVEHDDASVVVENQFASNVPDALSSKIRRRTCYECGERGHLSSSCPKIHQQDSGKKSYATVLEATPVDFKVEYDDASVVVENQVASNTPDALSSKIRRRTCYECGERGHLSSSCPKIHQQNSGKKRNATVLEATPEDTKAKSRDASTVVENQVASYVTGALSSKIRRRTCYECGERGHLSSSCPKKLAADDSTNPGMT